MRMRRVWIFLLLLGPSITFGQTPVAPAGQSPAPAPGTTQTQTPVKPQNTPQLSPQAAYEEAKRPLDITRAPYENWSEVEQNALGVAVSQAGAACKARSPYQFKGEDLIAYAKLCFFGEDWQPVQLAASNYILAQKAAPPDQKLAGFPSLAVAYDYSVQALLHMTDPGSAKGTAEAMLRSVPYDDMVSEATGLVARYLQFTGSEDDAISLLKERQPVLLALLKAQPAPAHALQATTSMPANPPSAAQAAQPAIALHTVYADAVALPALQQYADQPRAAAASFADVEAALPANLSPDDAIMTAATRREYLLLGAPVPRIAPYASLLTPAFTVPQDFGKNFGAATVLFVFPDWCGCVGMGDQFPEAAQRLSKKGVRFYALLAQDGPPPLPTKLAAKPASATVGKPVGATAARPEGRAIDPVQPIRKLTAAEYLAGTPTLAVPNQILNTFVAADFPLIVALDHRGIVRALQVAPQNALKENYLVDTIADHVLKDWPPPQPKETGNQDAGGAPAAPDSGKTR